MSSSVGATEAHKEEEADIKRRLFWIACSFDRTFNVLLGRPFTFDNLSVDVDLPGCSLMSTNRRQTLHWLELQRLQNVIVHRLHGTREAIDRHRTEDSELELSQWTIKMAEDLRDWNSVAQTLADPSGCDVNWWSYWYRTALLILYRPSSLRPSLSPSETLSCYVAAKELIQLSFLRISEGLADFTWIDLHFQFMSGITMILIIWKNVEARNKAQEDWISVKSSLFQWKLILERLGARWERIGRAREVLSKLADATVDLVEKDPVRSTGAPQARPLQGSRETRRSQRHSIIQRLRNLSQQDQSPAGYSRLPHSNAVSDRSTIQLCNNINNRNPEHRGQDVTNTQELPAGPSGWNWTDSDTNLQQETALGSQAVGNTSNWEAEETLWPLLNLSDITTGTDELDLWAYFSAPMLDMENLAIPNFNAGIRPDESLNYSILNFQGDLDHSPPQTGANGTDGSG
ncbi:positive regulator of purine utilization [Fusarium flagelliforme]|uniref:Positive regulator of purine utilization n=2 Tax=Fusarium flagelliforme TaxID=2675880 RepID=A0A395M9S5_9HYPO|nr:positive regulator of purine utilization [Fusarium flagelliforme]